MSNILLINKQKKFLKHGDNFLRKASHPERDYFYMKIRPGTLLLYDLTIGDEYYSPVNLQYNIVKDNQTYDENNFKSAKQTISASGNITIYFRCDNDIHQIHSPSNENENHFLSSYTGNGSIEIGGNIMSLFYKDFEDTLSLTLDQYTCMTNMFWYLTELTSIRNLKLPATTLYESCYQSMFCGCTSLTTVPSDLLPATKLAANCYRGMFYNCTSLTKIPELPATQMSTSCYYAMFKLCTKLRYPFRKINGTINAVPNCFKSMFAGCSSLIKSPDMTCYLIGSDSTCFQYMFHQCSSLTDISNIKIKNTYDFFRLDNAKYMFKECTSLTEIPENIKWSGEEMFAGCRNITISHQKEILTPCPYMYANNRSLTEITNTFTFWKNIDGKFYGDASHMFDNCYNLTTAPKLQFDKNTIGLENACQYMFYGCSKLTTVPKLSATTLTKGCYQYMFSGCTSLTTLPSGLLPATTMKDSCYQSMFVACRRLTTVPSDLLPATTIASSCYQSMFYGCTSLIKAPDLPATIAKNNCYANMFSGCTSLTTAYMRLTDFSNSTSSCYSMFEKCSKLSNVSIAIKSFTDMNNQKNTNLSYWLNGVASSGIMNVPNTYAWTTESITHSVNGIPSGWVVNPVL